MAVGDVDPARQKWPAAQMLVQAGVVRPTVAPNDPAGHSAVHRLDVSPDVFPYVPARHGLHTPDPLTLKEPAAHNTAVAFVEAAGHA